MPELLPPRSVLWVAYLTYHEDDEERDDDSFHLLGVFASKRAAYAYGRAAELDANDLVAHDPDEVPPSFLEYRAAVERDSDEKIVAKRDAYLGESVNGTARAYGYFLTVERFRGPLTEELAGRGRAKLLARGAATAARSKKRTFEFFETLADDLGIKLVKGEAEE